MTYLKSAVKQLMPPDYDMARWVEANRFLDAKSSAITGYKKIKRTPYLMPLYQWFIDEKIKEITVQKPAQIGLTDWVVDCILWIAANDPSPTALFLADQETAKKIMRFRIDPAFRQLGLIKRKVAANKKQEISKFEINLSNGFYLVVGWGSSISQTASMSFKRVFCDEINKPGYSVIKEEGDTLDRIRERMETFGDSKFVLLSTPTLEEGRITQELEKADTTYDYACPCPHCGVFQELDFKQVVWDGGSKATTEQISKSARYKCKSCNELWTEKQRKEAVAKGIAQSRGEEKATQKKVGYQLHRLNSLFKGGQLSNMISSFLLAQDNPEKLQNIVNSTFGQPFASSISPKLDDRMQLIANCRSSLVKESLPQSVVAIVCGIDTQMNGFYYRVRAVSEDDTTHGIDEGFVKTFEDLDHILFEKSYGNKKIWRALIDTGGGKHGEISRTEEVYNWIRANQGRGVQLFGAKGSSHAMATKIKIGSPIEKTPSGKPIPGGLRLIIVNTESVKDALWYRINLTNENAGAPGCWYVHRDTQEWVMSQICAEEKRVDRKKGIATWKATSKDNHLLDCECLCLVAIDPEFWGGIKPLLVQQKRQSTPKAARPIQQQQNPYTSGGGAGNPFTGGI